MDLQNKDWQKVIANKPDWSRFITRSIDGSFEYHENKPIWTSYGSYWKSKGETNVYYGFNAECLDLSRLKI